MWTVVLGMLKNKTVITAVALIALFFGGFTYGFKIATWKGEAEKIAAIQRAIAEFEEIDRIREEFDSETIAGLKKQIRGYVDGKEKVRVYIRDNPSSANKQCLDADGLRLYNLGPTTED